MTDGLICRVFAGRTQATAAAQAVQSLRHACGAQADMTTDMGWFLSRTLLWGNDPLVVLVDQGADAAAAVLLYQRRYHGVPTGVVKGGNGAGDGVVVAPPGLRTAALQAALAKVLSLPLVHTVLVSARGVDAPSGSAARHSAVDARWRVRDVETHLSLAGGFDGFLSRLRTRSRRNYRYFRRRAEKELGLSFVPSLAADQAVQAVEALHGASVFPMPRARALRLQAAIQGTAGGFAMGVRDRSGQWLSYIAGWRQAEGTFVEWQLNHCGFEATSLSTVMRTYFLEHEALHGVPQVVFVGGTSAALGRYCAPDRCFDIAATRGGLRGMVAKKVVTWLHPQGRLAQHVRGEAAIAPLAGMGDAA